MAAFDYHKFRLFVVHSKLERAIAEERKHRNPDHLRLSYLKRLKLAVKDRLSRTTRSHQPA